MVLGTVAILGLIGSVSSNGRNFTKSEVDDKGIDKRAASCDIDPSIPCECTNPFIGTENFFLGDSVQNCKVARACYVKNLSGCSDSRQAKGGGRCQSKQACNPTVVPEPVTEEPVTPEPLPPCPIGGDKICECLVSADCEECEVDCKSDCNDISKNDGKCFSKFACQYGLLFELECQK